MFFMFKKEKGYQKKKAGLEKLRKFVFTYIIDSIYLLLILIFFSASNEKLYGNYTSSDV